MKNLNKSVITNIIAISLIAVGYALNGEMAEKIKTMGLYAFSGAITNWLAIHMLFEKIPFLYGSGIITDRFEEFKAGIKSLITKQFFTKENIRRFLADSLSGQTENESGFNSDLIVEAIDFDIVFKKLKAAIMESPFGSMLGMFGGEAALDPLKEQFEVKFTEIIKDMAPTIIQKIQSGSDDGDTSSIDGIYENIMSIIDQRLNELTPKMVKIIIEDMIRKHLGWLVVWGGVFGALIGLSTTLL